jgi:transposase
LQRTEIAITLSLLPFRGAKEKAMESRRIERVDEIPLVLHWLNRMRIAEIIDTILPQAHGNRQGLSYGQLAVLFLCYVIHLRTHKLSLMEDWVRHHQYVLEQHLGYAIGDKEATDDRLADLLDTLGSDSDQILSLNQSFSGHLISAFELPTDVARYDTTSFNVYHAPEASKDTAGGLLQFGYSKDHRPDLLQFKQGLGMLSSSGVPIFSETLAGNRADDPLYIPAWRQMASAIGHPDFLYVADSKGAALETRATIAREGGRYLFPLPMTGEVPNLLAQTVLDQSRNFLELLWHTYSDETTRCVAKGFEFSQTMKLSEEDPFQWQERWLVTQSHTHAKGQRKSLEKRLLKAEKELDSLQNKIFDDPEKLNGKIDAVFKRHRVPDYFQWNITEERVETIKYLRPGRPGPNTPFRCELHSQFRFEFSRNQNTIDKAMLLAGWRIYVVNAPPEELSLHQAISYYRNQWEVEHDIQHWKKGSLPTLPLFLRIETRIRGLMVSSPKFQGKM